MTRHGNCVMLRAAMTRIAARPSALGAYRRGVLLVLAGSLCSSWIGLGVRMMEAATAWQILVYRAIGLIAFLLIVIALRNRGRLSVAFHNIGAATLVGGLGLAMAFSGGIVAMQRASIANALFLFGLLLAGAVCLASGNGIAVSRHDAAVALAMGGFQLGLALVLITLGSRSVPAAEISLLTMAEMVLAPLWVYLVYGETAGRPTLLGGTLLLTAIAAEALTGLRERRSS